MLKNGLFITVLVVLSACGDPLRDMPRLSDVDLLENDPARQALPSEAEIAREGFFGPETDFAHESALTTPVVSTPARRGPKPQGVLSMLRAVMPAARPTVRATAVMPVPADGAQIDSSIEEVAPEVEVASLSPAAIAPRQTGLLGRLLAKNKTSSAARDGVDAMDVTYGTVLPYGLVARVCDARRKSLGRKVESASASGYKLYDSNPGASGPRTYYVTGFDDDCPRQLTAAHVLLGAPSFYEQLHYGPAGAHLAFGETDRAYEKVKSRVCGARKGKPCGAKMRALERSTFFVNSYERMDDNTRWSELLVHDGRVVAASLKTN